jgi:hypothetical protein
MAFTSKSERALNFAGPYAFGSSEKGILLTRKKKYYDAIE